jgi:hypothetical protein
MKPYETPAPLSLYGYRRSRGCTPQAPAPGDLEPPSLSHKTLRQTGRRLRARKACGVPSALRAPDLRPLCWLDHQ